MVLGLKNFHLKIIQNLLFIKDYPLLLIDDECDHYSIDTDKPPPDPNGKFEEEYDPTKIVV